MRRALCPQSEYISEPGRMVRSDTRNGLFAGFLLQGIRRDSAYGRRIARIGAGRGLLESLDRKRRRKRDGKP